MKLCVAHQFSGVTGYELGNGHFRRPVMTGMMYLAGDILIDTGPPNMRDGALAAVSDKTISRILLTHHHEDHSGNAAAIMRAKQAPAHGHAITIEKMRTGFDILPYQHIMWGKAERAGILPFPESIEGENCSLIPVHTPGHSRDHTAFFEKNRGWLFSGDLYLGSRVKYFRADERIDDAMNSIRKVLKLDFDSLFCAHNPREKNGRAALTEKLDFLENFCGEIRRLIGAGYPDRAIIARMTKGEVRLVKLFTLGNVSLERMVREGIRAVRKQGDSAPATR